MRRFAFLDVLRGFAVLAVFAFHAINYALPHIAERIAMWINLGAFGVVLFFFCSGFVVPAAAVRAGSVERFAVSRAFRIFPAYWVSIGLLLIGFHYQRAPIFGDPAAVTAFTAAPVRTIVGNMLLLQRAMNVPHLIDVYWTLVIEGAFYVSVTIALAFGWINRPAPIAILLLGTGLALNLALLIWLGTIWAGAVFAGWAAAHVSRSAALATLALLIVVLGWPALSADRYGYVLAASRLIPIVVFGLAWLGRGLRWPRVTIGLGMISYSVYLLHQLVLAVVPGSPNKGVTLASWFLVTVVAAVISYYLIEKPGIAAGRRVTVLLSHSGEPQSDHVSNAPSRRGGTTPVERPITETQI